MRVTTNYSRIEIGSIQDRSMNSQVSGTPRRELGLGNGITGHGNGITRAIFRIFEARKHPCGRF